MSAALSTNPNFRSYRIAFGAFACIILAVPLVAMQFTDEVNWQLGDFGIFGVMLLMLGFSIEVFWKLRANRWVRATGIGLSIAAFIFIWAVLATG